VMWALMAPLAYGVALIREGKAAEGVPTLEAGLTVWGASGGKVRSPYLKAVLAEGMAVLGDIDGALHLIDAQIAQVERPGWEERVHYAEILRLKGWMLSLKGELAGTERNYLARSTGRASSRRSLGSCAHRPVGHGCGKGMVNARKPTNCSRRSTTGSPRASIRKT